MIGTFLDTYITSEHYGFKNHWRWYGRIVQKPRSKVKVTWYSLIWKVLSKCTCI